MDTRRGSGIPPLPSTGRCGETRQDLTRAGVSHVLGRASCGITTSRLRCQRARRWRRRRRSRDTRTRESRRRSTPGLPSTAARRQRRNWFKQGSAPWRGPGAVDAPRRGGVDLNVLEEMGLLRFEFFTRARVTDRGRRLPGRGNSGNARRSFPFGQAFGDPPESVQPCRLTGPGRTTANVRL